MQKWKVRAVSLWGGNPCAATSGRKGGRSSGPGKKNPPHRAWSGATINRGKQVSVFEGGGTERDTPGFLFLEWENISGAGEGGARGGLLH